VRVSEQHHLSAESRRSCLQHLGRFRQSIQDMLLEDPQIAYLLRQLYDRHQRRTVQFLNTGVIMLQPSEEGDDDVFRAVVLLSEAEFLRGSGGVQSVSEALESWAEDVAVFCDRAGVRLTRCSGLRSWWWWW
jgi:hypothetical protein